jgi:hypothetical protein
MPTQAAVSYLKEHVAEFDADELAKVHVQRRVACRS